MTINQRKYDLHVLNHNYAKPIQSPNELDCDDNVIEVPFDENANDSNNSKIQIEDSNVNVSKNKKKLKIKEKSSSDVS